MADGELDDEVLLTYDEAVALLPDGDQIHTMTEYKVPDGLADRRMYGPRLRAARVTLADGTVMESDQP